MFSIKEKNISVIGISKKGIAAALLAKNKGANVFMSDIKSECILKNELLIVKRNNILYETDNNSNKILEHANIIVRCSGVPFNIPILKMARTKGILVLDELEFALLFCKAKIIAVTGTNGKTTTIEILKLIFERASKKVFIAGNSGIPLSSIVVKIKNNDIVLIEVSCLHLEDLQYFKPYISFITNITPDHLDRYGTMKNYVKIKGNIFKYQTSKDYSIINTDDKYSKHFNKIVKSNIYYLSCKNIVKQGVYISNDKIVINMLTYKNKELCDLKNIKIQTKYNYPNILGAVIVAVIRGVKLLTIREALKGFSGVKHRFEIVGEFKGVKVINDSKATNEDATVNAINNCNDNIILILGGRDKKSSFSKIEKHIKNKIKTMVYYGEVKGKIYNVFRNKVLLLAANSLKNAIEISVNISKKGDTILFSPACSVLKNHFEDAEKRGEYFKRVIREVLINEK